MSRQRRVLEKLSLAIHIVHIQKGLEVLFQGSILAAFIGIGCVYFTFVRIYTSTQKPFFRNRKSQVSMQLLSEF